MIHVLILTVVIGMGVEAAEVKKRSITFPGRKVSVNGSMTASKPASSVLECGRQCLTSNDCGAANYEDAGVCHMLAAGPVSLEWLEDNSHTTAIIREPIPYSMHMVGYWPLQEAYGGEDLSGLGNHMKLRNVTFPDDGVTPWATPAAAFKVPSAGYIEHGQHLDVKSFSWMANVYLPSRDTNEEDLFVLFEWWFDWESGVRNFISDGALHTIVIIPGCETHHADIPLPYNAWYNMALTYDFPTNNLTLWLNGMHYVSSGSACGTTIATSQEFYVGISLIPLITASTDENSIRGRLSCMSLYNSVVDLDLMYLSTVRQCTGD